VGYHWVKTSPIYIQWPNAIAKMFRMLYIGTMLKILKKPEMKDIRPDLRERLRAAAVERDQLRPHLAELEAEIALLEKVIEREDRRFRPAGSSPQDSLADFLMENLRRGIATKDGLRAVAEGAGYEVDGRSIHATLVNLIKSGKAVEFNEGEYAARTQE
jgi:hypothetical protein